MARSPVPNPVVGIVVAADTGRVPAGPCGASPSPPLENSLMSLALRHRSALGLVAVLAVAAVVTTQVRSQQTRPDMPDLPAMQPPAAMQPGPHHELLKNFAGTWSQSMTRNIPGMPPIQEDGGRASYELVMGGRYLVGEYRGSFMGKTFEGRLTLGYDNLRKHYTSTWIDNHGTGILIATGHVDDQGRLVMQGTLDDPMTGRRDVPYREVLDFNDDGTIDYTMHMARPDGNMANVMSMHMTRRR